MQWQAGGGSGGCPKMGLRKCQGGGRAGAGLGSAPEGAGGGVGGGMTQKEAEEMPGGWARGGAESPGAWWESPPGMAAPACRRGPWLVPEVGGEGAVGEVQVRSTGHPGRNFVGGRDVPEQGLEAPGEQDGWHFSR